MIYAAETTHSNRERKLVQPLEGCPERLRHHLRRPHQGRTTLLIVDRGGLEDQQVQQPGDLRRERTDALVVARLLGQIWEQMRQAHHCEAQEAPLAGAIEQDLRDGQADQLGIGDLRATPCTRPARQELVRQHVKCRQKGVEVGGHAATSVVDVGVSNADLRHPFYVPSTRTAPTRGTESLI